MTTPILVRRPTVTVDRRPQLVRGTHAPRALTGMAKAISHAAGVLLTADSADSRLRLI